MTRSILGVPALLITALLLAASPLAADVFVQCPGDTNGDGISDTPGVVCKHLASGDGFVRMADGKVLYIFGFSDATGRTQNNASVMQEFAMAATYIAPTIVMQEGDKFYLSLTNTGFINRPDLFDPHTVHFHGYANAAAIFDGLPESAIAINIGSTATYYYRVPDPGTYMFHCHAEATEHMQMGMLGNLFVRAAQDKLPNGTVLAGGFVHQTGMRYAYNDGDGSTRYDVDVPLQTGSFDPDFHEASRLIRPLPFALMRDKYPLINGRGYPDTVNPGPLTPPDENGGKISQPVSSLVTATAGQRILLRLSNLNVTRPFTVSTLGIPMKVVGLHAKLLRGPTGRDLSFTTNALTLGSGETADAILDTTGVAPGTYYLYVTELNYLSNYNEDFGGIMTEIRIQ